MNIWKSKYFTARFVLMRAFPALILTAIAFAMQRPIFWAIAALSGTVSLVTILHDARKLPVLLAAAILCTGQSRAQERPKNALGACVIVIVIVINGYAYYRVVKACRNLKPRVLPPDESDPTNAPPKSLTSIDLALWQPPPEYCNCDGEKSAGDEPAISLTVENDRLVIQPERTIPESTFEALLLAEGLDPDQIGAQFSHNHARAGTSPISFTETGVAIAGANPREIVLERSDDLEHWQEFTRLIAPAGMKLHFTDATLEKNARFYRIAK